MNYKLLILDFDGTLGDTAAVIVQTMQATIRELRLPARTNEECRAMIGLPLQKIPGTLFADAMQGKSATEVEAMGAAYAETYRRLFRIYNTEGAVTLFPHVLDTLHELHRRGIILTIASSRSHASLAHYVEDLGMSDLISYVLGAEDVAHAKPEPDPVIDTLRHFNLSSKDALVVGDTSYDILMGKRAGALTCGVTYGNGSRAELQDAGADFVIEDFATLLTL